MFHFVAAHARTCYAERAVYQPEPELHLLPGRFLQLSLWYLSAAERGIAARVGARRCSSVWIDRAPHPCDRERERQHHKCSA
eukprot:235846-Chlamydomonas_euryale.AAC.1